LPRTEPVIVQWRASNSGSICVALQKVALGRVHAYETVSVEVTETQLRVHCDDGIRIIARTTTLPITRVQGPSAPQTKPSMKPPRKPRHHVKHQLGPKWAGSTGQRNELDESIRICRFDRQA